jgi:hypothetical protein
MTDLRDFHETAAYIEALNEYFHGIQKRFDEAQTLGEKLDLLAVSKEIISTFNQPARHAKQFSHAQLVFEVIGYSGFTVNDFCEGH